MADGVVIALRRLPSAVEIDVVNRRAVVVPGVTNVDISRAAVPYGRYFAPDPSSQQVCPIGGNVAENSDGPQAEVDERFEQVTALCERFGTTKLRVPPRASFWTRRSAASIHS